MKIGFSEILSFICLLVGLGVIFFTSSKPLTILAFVLIIAGAGIITLGKRKS